jgi:hypothetical protein
MSTIPRDVVENEILTRAQFAEVYAVRLHYPETYTRRLCQTTEMFNKLLVAIEHDDVELFKLIWCRVDDRPCTDLIMNLIVNVMTDMITVILPYKIFTFLLYGASKTTLANHLRIDDRIWVRFLDDRKLIMLMLCYCRGYESYTAEHVLEKVEIEMHGLDTKDYILGMITHLLIKDLVGCHYLDLGDGMVLSSDHRKRLNWYRTEILSSPIHVRDLEAASTVRSLGFYSGPSQNAHDRNNRKRFSVRDAKLWYDNLFDPETHREVTQIITDWSEIALYFDVIEGTIIHPELWVDCLLEWLSSQDDDEDAEIIVDFCQTIIIEYVLDLGMETYSPNHLISPVTKGIIAAHILDWLDRTEDKAEGNETEHSRISRRYLSDAVKKILIPNRDAIMALKS